MNLTRKALAGLILSLSFEGCFQMIAIKTMSGIMDYGFEALNEESDLQIAHEALGGNLKLIEALVKGDPENTKLLLFASQGYYAYALAFAEEDSVERARMFYLRGRDYGLRVLSGNSRFKDVLTKDDAAFREAIQSLSTEDVPAVFWTAINWGSYINITRAEMAALADLARVNALMEFVLRKNRSYYYGGADLFLGSVEGTTPVVLGGKPEISKEHFDRCIAANGGKFLMAYVYYAKTYCVQTQNKEMFESLLTKVDEASLDILPEARLANAVAKHKAKLLRDKMNDLF